MKKIGIFLAVSAIALAVLDAADPLYQADSLPSGSGVPLLKEPVDVSFTVPTDVFLTFSEKNTALVYPNSGDGGDNTVHLTTVSDSAGVFSISHGSLYAYWNVNDPDAAFEIHLYPEGMMSDGAGNELHWTISASGDTAGGTEGYGKGSHILLTDRLAERYEEITIDVVDIHNMLTAGTVPDGTYTGSLVLEYKDMGS